MPCPFLSRLPSQFVANYSSKLLKTYGNHCPVVSQGVTQSLAAIRKEHQQDQCTVASNEIHTRGGKDSPIKQVAAFTDIVEVKELKGNHIG